MISAYFVLSAAPLVVLGLAASAASAAEGEIHECTDAKGQVVYQDEPCIETMPSSAKPPVASTSPIITKPPRAPKPPMKTKPKVAALPPAPRPPEPASSGRSVDAKWATPERSLQTFVGAVKAGDRALVLTCLTSQALADLGPDLQALPLEKLRETVGSFTGYVAEGDLGPFWSIRALRAGTRPKWIFFERTGSGEWKIAAI